MSGLHPEAPSHDAPIPAVENEVGDVQIIPPSSDGSPPATTRAPAATEEHSTLESTATQGVLNPSGEVMPGAGEPTSSATRSMNAFDGALAEDIVTYGRISFEGLYILFLALLDVEDYHSLWALP